MPVRSLAGGFLNPLAFIIIITCLPVFSFILALLPVCPFCYPLLPTRHALIRLLTFLFCP